MQVTMRITTYVNATDREISPMQLARAVERELFSAMDGDHEVATVGRTFSGLAEVSFTHEESAELGGMDDTSANVETQETA